MLHWKSFLILSFLYATTTILVVQSTQVLPWDDSMLEKALSLVVTSTTTTKTDTATNAKGDAANTKAGVVLQDDDMEKAKAGDVPALYRIARALEDQKQLDLALSLFHHLADSEQGHIASQISLGFLYYKTLDDHAKALQYFIQAGERGPNQAALYNAGRIFAQHGNWVPAVAYIQAAATFPKKRPREANEQLTATCTLAFETACARIAQELGGLGAQASQDIFSYATLTSFPKPKSDTMEWWTVAMQSMKDFEASFVESNGQKLDYDALAQAVAHMRRIWERDAALLSPLQGHLLLMHMNDALGPLAGWDDAYAPAAGGYAEALALSQYCHGSSSSTTNTSADTEGDGSTRSSNNQCFRAAAASAVMYYRRANDTESAQRVYNMAREHPNSPTTAWKRIDQTPPVFDPQLNTAQPWWIAEEFATAHFLHKAFSAVAPAAQLEVKKAMQRPASWWLPGALKRGMSSSTTKKKTTETAVGVDGTTTSSSAAAEEERVEPTFYPYSFIRYEQKGAKAGAPWAEFILATQSGGGWNPEACRVVPAICAALREHASSLCRARSAFSKQQDVYGPVCGTDTIVSLVRVKPGTQILPHCGTTNRRLIMHWCLDGCDGVTLTVGGKSVRNYGDKGHGNAVVFDDSFEHSLQHNGSQDLYFILAVFAHPEVS